MLSIKMIMALLAFGAITHAAPVVDTQLGPSLVGRDAAPAPQLEDERQRLDLAREQARQRFDQNLQQGRSRFDEAKDARPEKRDNQPSSRLEEDRNGNDFEREQARQQFDTNLRLDRERFDRLKETSGRPTKRNADADPPSPIEEDRQRHDLDREQARQQFDTRLQQQREEFDRLEKGRPRPEKRQSRAEEDDLHSRLELDRQQAEERMRLFDSQRKDQTS